MAQIVVRNIPEGIMRELRRAARERGRSGEGLVRETLTELADRRNRWAEFARWSDEFLARQRRRGGVGPTAAELIREDREG